jgi:2-C-methyl-D-erythritol 4-phosphate cytidylyltransferase
MKKSTIVILASGVGNRFGDPVPKQYHLVNGRPAIEYTIRAALASRKADEVIIAARGDYINKLRDTYGIVTVEGGEKRNKSFNKVLHYIKNNYDCDKLVVTDAVNPLVTGALFDKFFDYLGQYDVVLTTSKIPTSLGCYDTSTVDRSRYYMIQNPHGYHFDMLVKNFNENSPLTVIAHQLPSDVKTKLYWDFTDYTKIIYPHDIAIVEALLDHREKKRQFRAHSNDVTLDLFRRMRIVWRNQVREWARTLDADVEYLLAKWDITDYTLHPASNFGLVFEASSERYGAVIVKVIPPFTGRYEREKFTLRNLSPEITAKLIDSDDERYAILINRIIPGDYTDFSKHSHLLEGLFKRICSSMKMAPEGAIDTCLQDYAVEMKDKYRMSLSVGYKKAFCKELLECALIKYHRLPSERFLIHGDISGNNALVENDDIKLIDPLGYYAPFVMEFSRFMSYELLYFGGNRRDYFEELKDFFGIYADRSMLDDAVFVDIVSMIFGAISWKDDNFKRAEEWIMVLDEIFGLREIISERMLAL